LKAILVGASDGSRDDMRVHWSLEKGTGTITPTNQSIENGVSTVTLDATPDTNNVISVSASLVSTRSLSDLN
jgi:hypothetical protein